MARKPSETWQEEFSRRLEDTLLLALRAEAFHAAVIGCFENARWPAGAPEQRRDLNRMDCYLTTLGETIDKVLAEVRACTSLATKGTVAEIEPRRRSRRSPANLKGEGAP